MSPNPLLDDATLAQLMRGLADAVIVCNPGGAIVYWNDAQSESSVGRQAMRLASRWT